MSEELASFSRRLPSTHLLLEPTPLPFIEFSLLSPGTIALPPSFPPLQLSEYPVPSTRQCRLYFVHISAKLGPSFNLSLSWCSLAMAPHVTIREESQFGGLTGAPATLAVIGVFVAGGIVLGLLTISACSVYSRVVRAGGVTTVFPSLPTLGWPRRNRAQQDDGAHHPNDQHQFAIGSNNYTDPTYPIPLQYISVGPIHPQPAAAHISTAGIQDPLSARGNHEVYRAAFPSSQLSRTRPGTSIASPAAAQPFQPPPPYDSDSEESWPGTPARLPVSCLQNIAAASENPQPGLTNHHTCQSAQRPRHCQHPRITPSARVLDPGYRQ